MTKKTAIYVRVPRDFEKDYEKFNSICEEKSINQSELIRKLIKKWTDEEISKE